MFGIGVDLCKAARLEKSLQSESFCRHVFAPAERAWLETLPPARRAQSAAAVARDVVRSYYSASLSQERLKLCIERLIKDIFER